LICHGPAKIGIDVANFAFIAAVTVLSGMAVSLAPLAGASRLSVVTAFQENTPGVTAGRVRRFSGVLVVGEIALATILLAAAALFLASFNRLSAPDPGFDARNVLTFHVDFAAPKYSLPEAAEAFQRLQVYLEAIPGVRVAGAGLQLPDRGLPLLDEALPLVEVEGRPIAATERRRTSLLRTQPRYFEAMGIPVVAGLG
jgi:hypothetical protein